MSDQPLDLPETLAPPAGFDSIIGAVRDRLSAARYRHSLGVAWLARALALRFGLDPHRATLAGLIHDIAKDEPDDRLVHLAERDRYPLPPPDHPDLNAELHAPAGVTLAREVLSAPDAELLEAIRRHTYGEGALGPYGAVLFVADKLEPRGKGWPHLPPDLGAHLADLDTVLLFAYNLRLRERLRRDQPIDVRTVHARNRLIARLAQS